MEAKKERLFDILNAKKGAEIEIEGIVLEFRKFTIADMMQLEKDGIDLNTVSTDNPKGIEIIAKAIFNQLTGVSQNEFENFKNFSKCLTVPLFTQLTKAFFALIEESKPEEKK